jgi:hypothetical protein
MPSALNTLFFLCSALGMLVQSACKQPQAEQKTNLATPTLAAEIEALRRAQAAFNRNDIAATVEAMDAKIEWTEPAEFPGGTYHGHPGSDDLPVALPRGLGRRQQ